MINIIFADNRSDKTILFYILRPIRRINFNNNYDNQNENET
jgi:hypothetical protein